MKKIIKYLLGIILLTLVVGISYLKFALPNIPVQEDLIVESSPERLERGRYLANHVNLCMDCHSERDWNLLTGPPKPGTAGAGGERFDQSIGFPGVFFSRNITPHGLGDWSDGEIYRAITSGVSRDNTVIFPVMPWPAYNKMATEDIYSLIVYLKSLQPIDNINKTSSTDFPVSLIKNTFPMPASPTEIPAKTDRVAYGGYLVNAGACVDCHSKKDDKGNNIPGTEFGGGMGFPMPGFGTVYSANLTSDKETGLQYTEESFIATFKSYVDSTYTPHSVGKGEFQTIMPWMMYGGMTEEDLGAIHSYLRSLAPIKNAVVKFVPES
jgi:hypothetical protein